MPKAENTPGALGMMTRRMPISRATGDGVERPGTPIGDQHEVAGIEAAFGGDRLDGIGHGGRCDAQDSIGRGGHVHAERRRDVGLQRGLGGRDIEAHFAAKETVGADAAEHQSWRP